MFRRLRPGRVVLASLLSLLVGGVAQRSSFAQDSSENSPDREAILKVAKSYAAAFEKGDVDALVAKWAPDAEYIDESGKITQGREGIAAMLRKNFKGAKGYKIDLQTTAFRMVTPDVALADGKATLTSPEGAEERTPYSIVWVKKDGNWMLRSLRDLPEDSDEEMTPTERLKPLTWLLGDWVSTEKTPGIQLTCHWAPGKSFLLLEYHSKAGEKTETTSQRIGWDPGNEQFHCWYFDSAGGFGEGVLREDDDQWSGEMISMLPDGRLGEARHIARSVDKNSWTWQARGRTVDGRPLSDVDVHFVR